MSQERQIAPWQNNSFIIRTLPSVKEFHLFGIKCTVFENNCLLFRVKIFFVRRHSHRFLLPKAWPKTSIFILADYNCRYGIAPFLKEISYCFISCFISCLIYCLSVLSSKLTERSRSPSLAYRYRFYLLRYGLLIIN